jgi:asparagine synthase (glutamine-hydrolysing)
VRGKRLLKQLVYRRVPREIMDRPKQGFGVPLGRWFRGELRPLVLDTLTPNQLTAAGIRDDTIVRRIVEQHMSGTVDHSARIWALLVLVMWSNERGNRRASSPSSSIPVLAPARPDSVAEPIARR